MSNPIDTGVHPNAAEIGFDTARLNLARHVMVKYVESGTTPGAAALVLRRSGVAATWAVGRHTYSTDAPAVQTNHLFDLASLTKVVATTTLSLQLAAKGVFDLDAPVDRYVPEFKGRGKARVTGRLLLQHCSGMPSHVHLWETCHTREEILASACRLELECAPATRAIYSDMGFMVLGMAIEAIGKAPLDRLFRSLVADPMGLRSTVFCPEAGISHQVLPTEHDSNWRGRLIHAEVHDENAAAMGGIAPHAGLFGPVADLGRFVQIWLNEGERDGVCVLPGEWVRSFIRRTDRAPGSTWALGWDTKRPGGSTAGGYFTDRSFGSLGFTGTSLWADPVRDLGVVLLTNRVHPTRENQGIRTLRPAFHDAVSEALVD